jgi:hypothetical protein
MHDGIHRALPKAEFPAFEADLRLQARADGVALEIRSDDKGDGTVDVHWTVRPRGAAATAPAPAAAAVAAAAVATLAPVAERAAVAFVLGKLSERFEVGGRGPGTVSTGIGDAGGVSYGSYQMTSVPRGGTVLRFVREPSFPFAAFFDDLTPGTQEFSDTWRRLAQEHPDAFKEAQHAFIRRTHFHPMAERIRQRTGIDVLTRSPALQDCIWSTAVQHGGANSIPIVACEAVRSDPDAPQPSEGRFFDEAWIRAIYAERGRKAADGTLVHFQRNSPNVQKGVARRFEEELVDALKMLNAVA